MGLVLEQCWILPVDVGVGVGGIQQLKFGEGGDTWVVLVQHVREAGGIPVDSRGAAHRGQVLQLFDVAFTARAGGSGKHLAVQLHLYTELRTKTTAINERNTYKSGLE